MNRTKTSKPSERRPPLPDALRHIPSLENLEEITVWLGTFESDCGLRMSRIRRSSRRPTSRRSSKWS